MTLRWSPGNEFLPRLPPLILSRSFHSVLSGPPPELLHGRFSFPKTSTPVHQFRLSSSRTQDLRLRTPTSSSRSPGETTTFGGRSTGTNKNRVTGRGPVFTENLYICRESRHGISPNTTTFVMVTSLSRASTGRVGYPPDPVQERP